MGGGGGGYSKTYFLSNFIHCGLCVFLSNFGFYKMPAHQIWSCHVAQEVNFENCLFCSNSTFNIMKNHKIFSGKALTSKVISQTPNGGGGGGGGRCDPISMPLGLIAEILHLGVLFHL